MFLLNRMYFIWGSSVWPVTMQMQLSMLPQSLRAESYKERYWSTFPAFPVHRGTRPLRQSRWKSRCRPSRTLLFLQALGVIKSILFPTLFGAERFPCNKKTASANGGSLAVFIVFKCLTEGCSEKRIRFYSLTLSAKKILFTAMGSVANTIVRYS